MNRPWTTEVRAPGKLYIAGEYAVVEPGFPAVLIAVDRYVTVRVRDAVDTGRITSDLNAGSQLEWYRRDSDMVIELNGEDAKGRVISRSVAQDESSQVFRPCVVGNAKCFGHVQCDSIIMGQAKISSVPEIAANDTEAQLIHEAAIGKIAGEQLTKLMTLGLTEKEAEEQIVNGFLK